MSGSPSAVSTLRIPRIGVLKPPLARVWYMVATSIGVMPPAPSNIDGKAGNSRVTPRRATVFNTFGTPTAKPRRAVDRL
ncbi:hypothetical protein D3C73_1084030 [compost metagenome]